MKDVNKIYQIYYDRLSKTKINDCFIPYDNTGNDDNEYELSVMRKIYEESWEGVSHKSVLSWKFESKFKTGHNNNRRRRILFSARQFKEFVDNNNRSYDFISANPFPSLEKRNVWEQGVHCHGDKIKKALNRFTQETGLGGHWMNIKFTEKTLCYCNYFSANKGFWDILMWYHEKMYPIAKDTGLDKQGNPLFPYVMERLLPSVLHDHQNEFKIKVFKPDEMDRNYGTKKIKAPKPRRSRVSLNKKEKPQRNLIVQIFFDHKLITERPKTHTNHNRGPLITSRMNNHQLFEDSQRITQEYAKKCGADYVLFEKPVVDFFSASMERMRLIEEEMWSREYDNILYIDCDTIISENCPNLFKEYPQETLRVCPTLMTKRWLLEKESTMVNRFGAEKVSNNYFNGGVILFHRSTLEKMRGKLKYRERFNTYAFDDQSELNWVMMENDIPMTMMSSKFNSKPNRNGMITHYLGNLKNQYNKKNNKVSTDKITVHKKIKPPNHNKNTGLVVLRCSELSQKELWTEGQDCCHSELIVCRDEKLTKPYEMIDDVLYVKSDRDKFEYKALKIASSLSMLKNNTHFGVIGINQNRFKHFNDIKAENMRNIHGAGNSLRFMSTSNEPFIVSRKSISYYRQSGGDKKMWRAKLSNTGIEIFNFEYLKS